MPPAVAVPLALAGVSLISQNANNKAAIKNNEVQQASVVGNTQQAYATAKNDLNSYIGAHPAPFTGANPGRPQAGAYGAGGPQTPSSYNVRSGPSQSGAGGSQALMALIQAILARSGGASSTPGSAAPPPAAAAPAAPPPSAQPGLPPPGLDAMAQQQWQQQNTPPQNAPPGTPPPGSVQGGMNAGSPVYTHSGEPGPNPSFQAAAHGFYFTGDSGNGQPGSGAPAVWAPTLEAAQALWLQNMQGNPKYAQWTSPSSAPPAAAPAPPPSTSAPRRPLDNVGTSALVGQILGGGGGNRFRTALAM